MTIGLSKARELSAKELDQVSGGGGFYSGTTNSPGWRNNPPVPHKPNH